MLCFVRYSIAFVLRNLFPNGLQLLCSRLISDRYLVQQVPSPLQPLGSYMQVGKTGDP
jgi:hypothetical protein